MATPELDSITITGFRSIHSMERLALGPINLLIGPNGSGKSNFIEVFSLLHAIREGHLQDYVTTAGGAERLLHFGSKNTEILRIGISFQGGLNSYEIFLKPTEADELIPISETVSFWEKSQHSNPHTESLARNGKEAGISAPNNSKIASYVLRHLYSWRLYHFHDTSPGSPMKKTADVNDNRCLRSNGSNLAPFLYYLHKKHEASYQMITRAVQRVAPFFESFQIAPLQLNTDKIKLEWRHHGTDAYFDAASLSDGTLRFIALATLFLQPDQYRPSVMVVDEPELGLHPYAITLLASLIKQASVTTQVIVSTQSSLLLDHFQPEDVLVANRKNGQTVFTRLERIRLDSWLEDYSLGQLWEKNELGGRPTAE